MGVEVVGMLACSVISFLLPTLVFRIHGWRQVHAFPWWRYRVYWESSLGRDDEPIEVSKDWVLERIRLNDRNPVFALGGVAVESIGSVSPIYVGSSEKVIRFRARAVPEDDEFSYYRVRRPFTRWRAITGQTALDTIGKHGMEVAVGVERLHNGEILQAGPYRVLATPISEHIRP